jgi:hypothetical protein
VVGLEALKDDPVIFYTHVWRRRSISYTNILLYNAYDPRSNTYPQVMISTIHSHFGGVSGISSSSLNRPI